MQKKILSIILVITLILFSVVPSFAANGDTVAPVSSTGSVNYYNGTSSYASYNATVSNWGNLITYITDGFARSIRSLANVISNASNNEITSIDNVWTRLGVILSSVDQIEGYIDGLESGIATVYSYLGDIKGYTDQIETKIDTSNINTGNIFNILSNGLNISFSPYWDSVKDALDPNGLGGFPLAVQNQPSQTLARYRQQENGGTSSDLSWDLSVRKGNALGNIFFYLATLNTSAVYFFRDVSSGIATGNTSDVITNPDLTTTPLGRVSIWSDIRKIGGNLSNHLARLDFVLASDEEIEARSAAASNQESVVDNFIKSSGDGSASASDFADIASAGSSIKDALYSNVSVENAFSSLSSTSSAWDWFTQSTANSLDSTTNQNRKSSNNDTPLLDTYYSDLMEILKVK